MLAGRDDLLGWQIYICDPDGTVGAYKYVCIGGGKNADKIASDIDELETIHRCSALTIVQARAFLIGYIKSKVISQLLQPLDSMNAQWRIQVSTILLKLCMNLCLLSPLENFSLRSGHNWFF